MPDVVSLAMPVVPPVVHTKKLPVPFGMVFVRLLARMFDSPLNQSTSCMIGKRVAVGQPAARSKNANSLEDGGTLTASLLKVLTACTLRKQWVSPFRLLNQAG